VDFIFRIESIRPARRVGLRKREIRYVMRVRVKYIRGRVRRATVPESVRTSPGRLVNTKERRANDRRAAIVNIVYRRTIPGNVAEGRKKIQLRRKARVLSKTARRNTKETTFIVTVRARLGQIEISERNGIRTEEVWQWIVGERTVMYMCGLERLFDVRKLRVPFFKYVRLRRTRINEYLFNLSKYSCSVLRLVR